MLASVIANSKITRTPLGISSISLNTYIAEQLGLKKFNGRYIQRVTTGSPAATAGLIKGDIITHINDKEIQSDLSLAHYRLAYGSGDTIDFTIYRNDTTKKLAVRLY